MVCLHWLIESTFPWRLITVQAIKSQLGFVWISKPLWISFLEKKKKCSIYGWPLLGTYISILCKNAESDHFSWPVTCLANLISTTSCGWYLILTSEKDNWFSWRLYAFLNTIVVSALMENHRLFRLLVPADSSKYNAVRKPFLIL